MALLPTGSHEKWRLDGQKEKCCPEKDPELAFDYDSPLDFLQEVSLAPKDDPVSLDLLDQIQCLASGGSVSIPSPALSDSSSDSGVLGSVASTEGDLFLAGLFGSRSGLTSLVPDPPTMDLYHSPTPSPSSVTSPVSMEPPPPPQGPTPVSSRTRGRDTLLEASRANPVLQKNRKNAEAARQNRIKKKKYVEGLEKECSSLKRDNVVLKTRCHEFQSRCQKLQSEVAYLRGVLANDSVLGSLIQNIPGVPGVRLTSSFGKRSPPTASEPGSSNGGAKRRRLGATGAGVCLHVSKDVVSLEFCENCSKLASS